MKKTIIGLMAVIILATSWPSYSAMLVSVITRDKYGRVVRRTTCSTNQPQIFTQSVDINTGQQVMTLMMDCDDITQLQGMEEEVPLGKKKWINTMTRNDWQVMVNRVLQGSPQMYQRHVEMRRYFDVFLDSWNTNLPVRMNRLPSDDWFDDN